MCGIAGELALAVSGAKPDEAVLRRMAGALAHRGPDASGIYTDGLAGLAHARLSIIDLAGGGQPMTNEDRSLWITFNGEIFNYVELRQDLIRRGHSFATNSDTEVILHLYEEKGEDCVTDLNGQWSFAIWDARRKTMFLSRDRFGVRPLFYALTPALFVFASEIKALFAHPAVSREIDPEALNEIFTFWFTLPPRTAFRNVFELPPGHSLTLRNGEWKVRRYWYADYRQTPVEDENECAEELLSKLRDAARIRLRADVPVGAYLSGGLDSTLTTALIRQETSARLRTFSVGFEDAEFDESRYQREAARFLGTDHEQVCCTAGDIGRIFPDVIWHTEKPVLRTAPAPMYLLSRLVRDRGFKVVVTGEGADELFGGYDIFKESKIRRFWAAQPESRWRPLLLRRLYPYLDNVQKQPDAYLRAFFHVNGGGPFFSHQPRWELTSRLKMFFSDRIRRDVGHDSPCERLEHTLPCEFAGWDGFSQAQYLETAYLLPGYILSSQGDRMAMAHSVEGRFPFLDYRVTEFASRLPARLRMKVLDEKYLLKRAARGLVPETILRRFKQPYRAPEAASFFGPNQPDYLRELLSEESIARADLFQPRAVAQLVRKFENGTAIGVKDNMALVGILSTQLLVQRFITNFSPTYAGT